MRDTQSESRSPDYNFPHVLVMQDLSILGKFKQNELMPEIK